MVEVEEVGRVQRRKDGLQRRTVGSAEGPMIGEPCVSAREGLREWLRSREALLALGMSLSGSAILIALGPGAVLALLLLVTALFLVLVRPGLFLLLSTVLYSMLQGFFSRANLSNSVGLDLNLSQLFVVTLTVLWALRILLELGRRDRSLAFSTAHGLHLLFVAWAAISLTMNPSAAAATTLARLAACLAIHGVGWWIGMDQDRAEFVPAAIGATSMIAGLSAGYEALTSGRALEAVAIGALRAEGSFGGPVSTATVALVGVPVFATWIQDRKLRWRPALGLFGFFCVAAAIAATLTRTALVGVILFALFAVVGTPGETVRKVRTKVLLFVLPLALVAAALFLVPDKYMAARSEDLPGSAGLQVSAEAGSGRGLLWAGMLRIQSRSTPKEWLFGHGLESVLTDLPKVTGLSVGGHNSYLEILYQLGILGTAIFALLVIANFRALRVRGATSAEVRRLAHLWMAYYAAFLLSTIMFNGYVWGVGAQWFTFLGLGYAQAQVRTACTSSD